MRRIKNSDALKNEVLAFNEGLFVSTQKREFRHPKERLKILRRSKDKAAKYDLLESDIVVYLKKIEDEYDRILNADGKEMKKLIREFNRIIHSDRITKAFHESVINAMQYSSLRQLKFPQLFRKMNIKTCVYCHSQFTLVVSKEGSVKWRALLQLDHKYAKSKYPFLCTSFYNLYPICANCNLSKSDKPISFELYVEDDNLDLLHFGLTKKSVVKYWQSKNADDLEVKIKSVNGNTKLLDIYGKMFNIKQIYELQKDIVEELVHKAEVYNRSYKGTLVESFKKLFPDQSMINRLLIGNYDKSSEMLKRPMAKFVQEIARDIKLIPKEHTDSDSWTL